MSITPEQIDRIVSNQHHDPFEILGPHFVEQEGKPVWVVRAYLPSAHAAWVICPSERTEYEMRSQHHPHFFECTIPTAELANYQLRLKEDDHERVIYDPYAFKSPLLTDLDLHLYAEGNHHRIYEKLGAHVIAMEG
jgi:1,4-alpha-glucan branching enzyme